jgi:energy-coupling factor transport system ATP-binding protein
LLSGGQKQRVAIAGILAIEPDYIVLDESTAMLDPIGRKEVMKTIKELNEKQRITIILITHHMEDAIRADRIVVIDHGNLLMEGTPREIFSKTVDLRQIGLDVPQITELFFLLKKAGLPVRDDVLNVEEAVEELCRLRYEM